MKITGIIMMSEPMAIPAKEETDPPDANPFLSLILKEERQKSL